MKCFFPTGTLQNDSHVSFQKGTEPGTASPAEPAARAMTVDFRKNNTKSSTTTCRQTLTLIFSFFILTTLGCAKNTTSKDNTNDVLTEFVTAMKESNPPNIARIAAQSLPGKVMAFYLETIPLEGENVSPGEISFGSGILSLVDHHKKRQILFSIGEQTTEGEQSIEFDYPWKHNVRYKVYVSADFEDGNTVFRAYWGVVADADGFEVNEDWTFVGKLQLAGFHLLNQPTGFVVGKEHDSANQPVVDLRGIAAAFGQGWIKTREYNWQPIHVVEYQTENPFLSGGEVYEDNMVAICVAYGFIARGIGTIEKFSKETKPLEIMAAIKKIDAAINPDPVDNKGSRLKNGFRFEFDRTADVFPVMPK